MEETIQGVFRSEHPLFRYFEHPVFIVELYQYLKGMNLYGHPGVEGGVLPLILIDFIRGLAYNIKEVLILVLHIVERSNMEYLSIKQTSDKWGISVRRIQVLCSEDRIPGATKIGLYWAIPADAEKPNDERIKSGKYIKEN